MKLNPWPVTIIVFFVLFLSGLMSFVVFATHQSVELVRPDYYEEEIHYQAQLDRIKRTQVFDQANGIAYDTNANSVLVQLPKGHAEQSVGRITLYRPSDSGLDRVIPLHLNPDGLQVVDTKQLHPGLWKIRVQWEVAANQYYLDKSVVVHAPKRP